MLETTCVFKIQVFQINEYFPYEHNYRVGFLGSIYIALPLPAPSPGVGGGVLIYCAPIFGKVTWASSLFVSVGKGVSREKKLFIL